MKSADEITERERSEAALRASEARYRTLFESIEARQAFLLALSDALRPLTDSAEMERTAMRLLGEELGVDRAFYATIDDDGKYWSIQHDYANGLPSNAGRYPMSELQRKRLMEWQQGHVTSIADSETDPSLTAEDRAAYALAGARAGIGVPLVKGGRFAALLALNQTEPREWTAAELALTNEVAERTWAEIERARAEATLHTLNETLEQRVTERTAERDILRRQLAEAEEAERRRLARELHDQLGQDLTAFRLGIDEAIRLAATHNGADASSTGPLLNRLMSLQTIANQMTTVVRSIAIDLRPPELDDVGLGSAIETYVREWSSRYGVTTEVAATGLDACGVKPEVTSAVYRILQEALTNVAKHAGASSVSVIGACSNNELRLVIEDNGRGFDVTASRDVGLGRQLGVAGMKERAALVDGTASVESTDEGGTTVYIRIPIGTAPHT